MTDFPDRWQRNCEITRLHDEGLTPQVIGSRYGLTPDRIRQIVITTQRKLRRREHDNAVKERRVSKDHQP